MNKGKKILAVLLCAAIIMPLLPQPEAETTAAAAGDVEIRDEKNNLFDMSKMKFPSTKDAPQYLQAGSTTDAERGEVMTVSGVKAWDKTVEGLSGQQFFYWADVAWESGVTYHISYYYKVSHESGGTFRFYPLTRIGNSVYHYNTDNAFNGVNHSPNTAEWTKQEITWTASAVSTGGYSIFGYNLTLFAGDTIYLDDIVIEKEVPGFTGAQAVLSDGIQLKLYINDAADVSGGLSAKVNGESTEIQQSTDQKQYIMIPLAAKEMTDTVKADLYLNGEIVNTKEYSVREYAEALLKDNTHSSSWELVKAMLNYGAWAQTYFNYKSDDLANSIVSDTDKFSAEKQDDFLKKIAGDGSITEGAWNGYSFPNSEGAGQVMSKAITDDETYGKKITVTGTSAPTESTGYYLWNDFAWEAESAYKISYWIKTTISNDDGTSWVYPCPRYAVTDENWVWRSYKDGMTDDKNAFKGTNITKTTEWHYVEINWSTTKNVNEAKERKMAFNFKLAAGDSVSVAGLKIEKAGGVVTYQTRKTGELDGFLGYTLVLKDTASVRLYFDEELTSAKIDEEDVDVRTKGSRYYIEISDVKAGELYKPHKITVTGGEQTMTITNFSVLSAATAAIQSTSVSDNLKNVCIALVLYAEAAKAL